MIQSFPSQCTMEYDELTQAIRNIPMKAVLPIKESDQEGCMNA